MKTLIKILDNVLAAALLVAMVSILLSVSWQVLSRYILKDPSSWTEELARFLLIWIGMLGAAYAYRRHSHLGLNLLVNRMTPLWQRIVTIGIELVVIVFSAMVMVYGGSQLVALTIELQQISAALGIDVGIVYSVLPISGSLIIIYALYDVAQLLNLVEREEA